MSQVYGTQNIRVENDLFTIMSVLRHKHNTIDTDNTIYASILIVN